MATHQMKQNDTSPYLKPTLKDAAGAAVDLSGATVVFHMRDKSGAVKIDGAATVAVDLANGRVNYEWQAGDTDTPGRYEGEFEVTYSGGETETFPNKSYIDIQIDAEVS